MIRTYPTANSSMAATAQRYVPGKPPPLPKAKAIGINPTTTDSGAAAAMTMKTMSAVPSTRSRNSDAARSVMFSPRYTRAWLGAGTLARLFLPRPLLRHLARKNFFDALQQCLQNCLREGHRAQLRQLILFTVAL